MRALFVVVLAFVCTIAHADAIDPRMTCPRQPPADGTSCLRSMGCRYPRRGIACECQRMPEGVAPRRQWVCGELGE